MGGVLIVGNPPRKLGTPPHIMGISPKIGDPPLRNERTCMEIGDPLQNLGGVLK